MDSVNRFNPLIFFNVSQSVPSSFFVFSATKTLISDTVSKISDVSINVFHKIKDGFKYLTAAVPILMTIVAAASLQKNAMNLYNAIKVGSKSDIKRYCLDTLRDVFNLISYLTAAIQTLGKSLKTLSTATLSLVNIISCSVGIVVDSIHLVRQAIHLHASYKVSKMIDTILQDRTLNAKEKVFKILTNLEEQFRVREDVNEDILRKNPNDYAEVVRKFLDDQMKIEMSAVLGPEAYDKIKASIEVLRESNEDLNEIFFGTAPNLRDARDLLGLKIRQHWVEIAMDVVSIAAQALCIAFPQVGITLYIVYTLWTSYGIMLISNKKIDWVEKKKYTQADIFSREALKNKEYTKTELKKVYKTLKKRISYAATLSFDPREKKVKRLSKALLDNMKFNELKYLVTLQVQSELKEEMQKLLHQAAHPKMTELENISFANLKELKKFHTANKTIFESSPESKKEWNKIKERIAILEGALDQLFSRSLTGVVRKLNSQLPLKFPKSSI